MSRDIPESDWRLFRQLRPIALNRFCERVLGDVQRMTTDAGKSPHERYLALYTLIKRKDRDLAQAFDDPRRSTALMQIGIIHSYGLLKEDELNRFTSETRDYLSSLSNPRV